MNESEPSLIFIHDSVYPNVAKAGGLQILYIIYGYNKKGKIIKQRGEFVEFIELIKLNEFIMLIRFKG